MKDHDLKILIELIYDRLNLFQNDKAYFEKNDEKGFISYENEIYLLGNPDAVYYKEKPVLIREDGKYGIVNKNFIPPEAKYQGFNFLMGSGDLLQKFRSHQLKLFQKDDLWAIYDLTNEEFDSDFIFGFNENEFPQVFDFYDSVGLIALLDGQDYESLYNVNLGKAIANEEDYDSFSLLINNRAQVRKDGKYGFINEHGDLITDIIYDETTNFIYGIAGVRIGNKVGYIHKNGEYIVDLFKHSGDLTLEYYISSGVHHGVGNLYFAKHGDIIYPYK